MEKYIIHSGIIAFIYLLMKFVEMRMIKKDKKEVKDFIKEPFDLLINYYDTEKVALLLVSHQSKAGFKVGFTSIDKRLNHFMINTNAENFKVFMDELFKYLKILNKI